MVERHTRQGITLEENCQDVHFPPTLPALFSLRAIRNLLPG
jgi:hypothetical protein